MGKRLVGQMKKTLTPALSKFCASAHWPVRRGFGATQPRGLWHWQQWLLVACCAGSSRRFLKLRYQIKPL